MMVLVAFELGYLTPPVAINHLLARQVIGDAARVEDIPVEGGWVAKRTSLAAHGGHGLCARPRSLRSVPAG